MYQQILTTNIKDINTQLPEEFRNLLRNSPDQISSIRTFVRRVGGIKEDLLAKLFTAFKENYSRGMRREAKPWEYSTDFSEIGGSSRFTIFDGLYDGEISLKISFCGPTFDKERVKSKAERIIKKTLEEDQKELILERLVNKEATDYTRLNYEVKGYR